MSDRDRKARGAYTEALRTELAARQLYSPRETQERLRIDADAYAYLIRAGQLTEITFDLLGHRDRRGVPRSQVDGVDAVFRGGAVRLVRDGVGVPYGAKGATAKGAT